MHNIIWFRNDLRTVDNPAMAAALANDNQHHVRAVFFITEQQWQKHDWGPNKIGFVLSSVMALSTELAKLNIPFDILECSTYKEQITDLIAYLNTHQASNLYYNQEYEVNEQQRDLAIEKLLPANNILGHSFNSQTIIAPGTILTQQQTPYTVFTPFKKSCYAYLLKHPLKLLPDPKPTQLKAVLANNNLKVLDKYQHYLSNPILKLWPAGQQHALQLLHNFCVDGLDAYKAQRDFPAINGTSKLSAHLAVGAISVRQCFLAAQSSSSTCWLDELLWRDFYRQIMFHFPQLCRGKNFNAKYDKLKWLPADKNLELWQTGKTGVPIVDAAMRQLVTTGWMHNRLRMIVAMFLTKNLLIDWRHGEKFFSQHLVDLDLASNNGGWQWSASTGTDAVPYFRIFNPITQSERFDSTGTFIKRFCPELQSLSAKQIHDPSSSLSSAELAKLGYPRLMIDIKRSRERALEYFKAL